MNIKRWIPASARRAVVEFLGIRQLRDRMHQLEERVILLEAHLTNVPGRTMTSAEVSDAPWQTSRQRWKDTPPDSGLTWGTILTGSAFVEQVGAYGAFSETKKVLELGPGYGRLLRSVLDLGFPFARYVGIDLSASTIGYLRAQFPDRKTDFLQADGELCELDFHFDTFLSSLTMKHLYPTFEACLKNLSRFANTGSLFFFDLIEGEGSYFERDGMTFLRQYSKREVKDILRRTGLVLIEFGQVRHDDDHVRLLVVAKKTRAAIRHA
jgi:SAM-dependent methyltransferase